VGDKYRTTFFRDQIIQAPGCPPASDAAAVLLMGSSLQV
jgi:hypothetical protein